MKIRTRHTSAISAVAIISLMAGCSRPAGPDSTTASSGNVDFRAAQQFTIDATPVATMGGAGTDPKWDVGNVSTVVALSDGRYATFGSVGNRLMIFDSLGNGQRIWGTTGEGPGYFMRTEGMLLLPGDTLFLADDANHRLNWAVADKGVVHQEPFDHAPRGPGLVAIGLLRNRQVVAYSPWVSSTESDSITRPMFPVTVMDLRGENARAMDSVPGYEIVRFATRYRGRAGYQPMGVRFGLTAHLAAWDTMIATASSADYLIELKSPDGHLLSTIRAPVSRRPVSQAMRDAWIASELGRITGGGEGMVDPEETRRLIRAQPFADSLPPISGLFVTPDRATLWAVDGHVPSDSAFDATAFSLDGKITGRLHVASRGRPVAFTNDQVIIRVEAEDGSVSLRVYRIIPTARN